jgi:glycosyltransferase involved in cell wall biosynthesis
MSGYRVCVYAICKDEGKFVDRWMDSMGEADLIVVTDTGSTDATVEHLRARGATVYEEIVSPWRFDVARNLALSHVPDDVDICVCTDLDEVFSPGWRKALERAWTGDAVQARYLYNWSLRPDGSPDIQFLIDKAHARAGFAWRHPVHEVLDYAGDRAQRVVRAEMTLTHYPDPDKSRGSYLPLLELAASEEPESDRAAHYLGREYFFRGMWQDAIRELRRHLALPSATWREERCASMRLIAQAEHRLKDDRAAYQWFFRAIAECPGMREPHVEFARLAEEASDWPLAFLMAEEALRIKEKSASYVNMGYAWDATPDDIAAIAAYWLGMYERSLAHAEIAVQIEPENARLLKNLEIVRARAKPT